MHSFHYQRGKLTCESYPLDKAAERFGRKTLGFYTKIGKVAVYDNAAAFAQDKSMDYSTVESTFAEYNEAANGGKV